MHNNGDMAVVADLKNATRPVARIELHCCLYSWTNERVYLQIVPGLLQILNKSNCFNFRSLHILGGPHSLTVIFVYISGVQP